MEHSLPASHTKNGGCASTAGGPQPFFRWQHSEAVHTGDIKMNERQAEGLGHRNAGGEGRGGVGRGGGSGFTACSSSWFGDGGGAAMLVHRVSRRLERKEINRQFWRPCQAWPADAPSSKTRTVMVTKPTNHGH